MPILYTYPIQYAAGQRPVNWNHCHLRHGFCWRLRSANSQDRVGEIPMARLMLSNMAPIALSEWCRATYSREARPIS